MATSCEFDEYVMLFYSSKEWKRVWSLLKTIIRAGVELINSKQREDSLISAEFSFFCVFEIKVLSDLKLMWKVWAGYETGKNKYWSTLT